MGFLTRGALNRHTVVILAFCQLLLLAAAFAGYVQECQVGPGLFKNIIVLVSFGASMVLNVFITARVVRFHQKEALLAARLAMAQSFNRLAESMRTQNRDFAGHIRNIAVFCRDGRIEDLAAYLENLSGKISVFNEVLQIDNPVIGALLKAKATEADVRHIKLEINVSTSLAQLGERVLAVARIIGNLIDNAFDAASALAEQERVVAFEARRAGPLLQLEVSNRAPAMEEGSLERIFEPGYTTKGQGHSGLGLHIVKSLTESLLGTVKVVTDEAKGVRFVVTLPCG